MKKNTKTRSKNFLVQHWSIDFPEKNRLVQQKTYAAENIEVVAEACLNFIRSGILTKKFWATKRQVPCLYTKPYLLSGKIPDAVIITDTYLFSSSEQILYGDTKYMCYTYLIKEL